MPRKMTRNKRVALGLLSVGLLAVSLAPQPAAAVEVVPASRNDVTLSFAPVVKQAAPAVVNIYTQKVVRARAVPPIFNDPLFRQFFGNATPMGVPQKRVESSLGSGVIVRLTGLADSVLVTNNHVIEGADQITVVLHDRREFEAELVGRDERSDLAVLRLVGAPKDLPSLALGKTSDLDVGDLVLAIGNPFGVGQTVTSGIVSALGRHTGSNSLNSFIQTDAAINPGNSGGALVTMDGKLAGINSAIYTRDGSYLGIGFAIPAEMVQTVARSLLTQGKVVRPWIGISGQPLSADIAASLGISRAVGVLVNGVSAGSPSERAGLKVGDVVLAVDGQEVVDPQDMRYQIAARGLGGTVALDVLRSGNHHSLNLPLEAPAEKPARDEKEITGRNPLAGTRVANLNPALAEELDRGYQPNSVLVTAVQQGGYAARLGVEPGDVIRQINGVDVVSVRDLLPMLQQTPAQWMLTLQRGDRLLNMRIQ